MTKLQTKLSWLLFTAHGVLMLGFLGLLVLKLVTGTEQTGN